MCLSLVLFIFPGVPAGGGLTPEFVTSWGKKGSGPGEFNEPFGVALDKGFSDMVIT